MPEMDNTKIVQENIEAFNAGDWRRFEATLTGDSAYEEPATQRKVTGAREVTRICEEWKQAFPDAKGKITKIFSTGDTVAAEIEWEGTHRGPLNGPAGSIPASNKRIKVRASQIVTVSGGKIKDTRHYFDMMGMMQQIGARSMAA